jgi:diacylglycerol O-acyltransferase / wax synthase
MPQLTTLDAGIIKAQDPDRHASMAIGAVAVVVGAAPDYGRLKMLLAERIQRIPRCTQVLRTDWVEHPGFDLAHHLRRVALPRPGDDAELFGAIAHALERPLDIDLPLWECWIIEGLKGNRWAILMKVHHCMADEISAAHLLTRLCDDAEADVFVNNAGGKHLSPSRTDTRDWTDALWRASGTVCKATARALTWPVTWTSPARPATTMRRYSTVRIPRAAVDSVCRKFGVTANDVALAAITAGFRTVLLHRGEQPRADSLRTLEKTDDHVSAMLPYLPVEHEDPVQRLRTVHKQLTRTTQSARRRSPSLLELAANCTPLSLCAKVIQELARLPRQGIVTLATNVPGPRHRLRLMGQWMEQLLPIPPTALQLSTGVSVLSYGDELVFGITADYEAAPDMARLAAGIELGMAHLVALSQDSVLLFTKERRKRSRTLSSGRRRAYPPPARARY